MINWFACPAPRPHAAVRLFCLPYAGAGTAIFHAWPAGTDPRIEVNAVRLPGRESRVMERPDFTVTEVAAQISERAGEVPFALYGHSMGGLLGFEVVRTLRDAGARLPVRLYVGGSGAPDSPRSGLFSGVSRMSDAELLARVAEGGGAPGEVLADPDLVELVLPALRGDLSWVDGYVYRAGTPLPTPITAFAGTTDQLAPPEAVERWSAHTVGGFTRHDVAGGHFFLNENRSGLLEPLVADLLAALG
jgi:surfactin synthase thioesterase subunit